MEDGAHGLVPKPMLSCPVCDRPAEYWGRVYPLDYFICTDCRFVFAPRNYWQDIGKQFYNSATYSQKEDHWPQEQRLGLFKSLLMQTEELGFSGFEILDFGCGVKDIEAKRALAARTVFYDPFFQHPLVSNSLAAVGKKFQVIFCTEVIEHVYTQQALARELSSCLAPGGAILATTLLHDYKFNLCYLDRHTGHVAIHTLKSIKHLFGACGLAHQIHIFPGDDQYYFHLFR